MPGRLLIAAGAALCLGALPVGSCAKACGRSAGHADELGRVGRGADDWARGAGRHGDDLTRGLPAGALGDELGHLGAAADGQLSTVLRGGATGAPELARLRAHVARHPAATRAVASDVRQVRGWLDADTAAEVTGLLLDVEGLAAEALGLAADDPGDPAWGHELEEAARRYDDGLAERVSDPTVRAQIRAVLGPAPVAVYRLGTERPLGGRAAP